MNELLTDELIDQLIHHIYIRGIATIEKLADRIKQEKMDTALIVELINAEMVDGIDIVEYARKYIVTKKYK